jgi:hypothetical protein
MTEQDDADRAFRVLAFKGARDAQSVLIAERLAWLTHERARMRAAALARPVDVASILSAARAIHRLAVQGGDEGLAQLADRFSDRFVKRPAMRPMNDEIAARLVSGFDQLSRYARARSPARAAPVDVQPGGR